MNSAPNHRTMPISHRNQSMQVCGFITGEFDIGQVDGPAEGVSMRGKLVQALENEAAFTTGGAAEKKDTRAPGLLH